MLLSNFAHRRQQRESDCLVACAEMVLNHIGIQLEYNRLAKLLRAGPSFTPFSNLRYLASLGLSITIGKDSDLSLFEQYIEVGLPVVVAVRTINWPHWGQEVTEHAVVVVGIDRNNDVIFINDPFFADTLIEMELLRFETGWEELDRRYAVIGLAPPEPSNSD
jgi:ABC-type bacteriocin/lantibiotic exporter with double-glycine peptidase domain